jgi:DNA-binding CsgD family transcriptional regulator/tetratricopeptide (TPR) repeat protein
MSTTINAALSQGRAAYARQAWTEALEQLQAADRVATLDTDDLSRLATAAYLSGDESASSVGWSRLHHACIAEGNIAGAARSAFWIAFHAQRAGQRAPAGVWLARGMRIVEESGVDMVERGYFLYLTAMRTAVEGDPAGAMELFREIIGIGERFGDADLVAMARQGLGRTLVRIGRCAPGAAMFDEAMASVTSGEVSPMLMGGIYCSVIEGCHEMFDLGRAREWTVALDRWCAAQPARVPSRGNCQVHRSRMLQFHGDWPEALSEAERAQAWLSQPPPQQAIGPACYQVGDMHRLQGDFGAAESAYKEASRWGRDPEPGLAELRLAQGHVDQAKTAICRALDQVREPRERAPMLAAGVHILLAAGDVTIAAALATEMARLADEMRVPYVRAISDQANGAVLLAQGNPGMALPSLRAAVDTWQSLNAPYETAQARTLMGQASQELGHADAAIMEFEAAHLAFELLEATPDLERLERLMGSPGDGDQNHGLTPREAAVVRLLASGATNRIIATELGISEKTVARHASNIFLKLGLPNRAAATAWAHRQKLV